MIYGGITLGLLLVALVFVAWQYVSDRVRRNASTEIVAREIEKIIKADGEKVVKLPDPERPINPQEVSDALRKLRDLGRKPL